MSLDPLLLLVCVDHSARTHAHLHAKKRFGVNVLAEHQRVISEYYARPGRGHEQAEEEAGARFDRTAHGTPVLHGALAYLECRLKSAQDAGDHTIFIAEVEDVVVRRGRTAAVFPGQVLQDRRRSAGLEEKARRLLRRCRAGGTRRRFIIFGSGHVPEKVGCHARIVMDVTG